MTTVYLNAKIRKNSQYGFESRNKEDQVRRTPKTLENMEEPGRNCAIQHIKITQSLTVDVSTFSHMQIKKLRKL